MIVNPISTPLDIIILAGQSNAEGNGHGAVDCAYVPTPEILMMQGNYTQKVAKNAGEKDFFVVEAEKSYSIDTAKERVSGKTTFGNLALTFAKKYKENLLESERKILIVNTAVGGTGFAKNHWGIGEVLFERLMEMTSEALKMNSKNRVVALLWHQGEHDAYEFDHLTDIEREDFYKEKINILFSRVRESFGKMPIICGRFASPWEKLYKSRCEAIYSATEKVCKALGSAVMVTTSDLTTNAYETGNSDDIHFSRKALYLLGERYYGAYEKILKEKNL